MNAAVPKWAQAALAAVSVLLLSSCWSAKEIDEMRYAHAIGIDYEDGKYILYVQMVNFLNGSGSGGRQNGGSASVVVNVIKQEGKTIVEAVHNVYRISQRRIFWGHVTSLLLGEGLLRHRDMDDVFDTFARSHDLRYTIWIFTAKSSIRELMTALPMSEQAAIFSKISNPIENFKQSSFVEPVKLHRFLSTYHEYGRTTIIPVLQLEEKKKVGPSDEQNTIMIHAFSVFQDLEYVGTIYGDEGSGVRWVQNKAIRVPLDIQTEHGPGRSQTASLVMTRIHASIDYTPGGRDKFTIRVGATGQVYDMEENLTIDRVKRLAEEKIKEEIMTTYKAAYAMGADVYSLQYEVFRRHPGVWRKLKKEGRLLPAPEQLQVEARVFVKSTGSLRAGLKKVLSE